MKLICQIGKIHLSNLNCKSSVFNAKQRQNRPKIMAEPISDDSLTTIDDTHATKPSVARYNPHTKLTKILFNDEVQKAIEQVGARCNLISVQLIEIM